MQRFAEQISQPGQGLLLAGLDPLIEADKTPALAKCSRDIAEQLFGVAPAVALQGQIEPARQRILQKISFFAPGS